MSSTLSKEGGREDFMIFPPVRQKGFLLALEGNVPDRSKARMKAELKEINYIAGS